MYIKSLLLSALAATGVVARRSCGAPTPTDEQNLIAQNFQLAEAAAKAAGNESSIAAAAAAINIKVYYHVVSISNSASGGYLTQAQLNAQTAVLNDAFAPQGVSFAQAGVDWTVNTNWANDRSILAMKRALRKGTYADLNVYFIYSSSYLGYAYFPTTITAGSTAFYQDGVVLLSSTVPGGEAPFDLGHTLTHEVGHFLGLSHTWGDASSGGCTNGNDFVDDTPAENEPAFGCQIGRDTCPTLPGTDPVTNFMDYSDDACFTSFTAGQTARIVSFWDTYRAQYA